MSDQNLNAGKVDNIDDIIVTYQQTVAEELGLDKLPPEKRKKVEAQIADLVNKRVTNIILAFLPEEKADEFKNLLEGERVDKIVDFLRTTVPDIEAKIANDLMLLRKELISKLAK